MIYFREKYRNLCDISSQLKLGEIARTMGSQKVTSINQAGITPVQQMLSSCTGALITSIVVTPLDVVKIRIQAQQKEFLTKKCFIYCNGLMEHICYCNGNGTATTKSGSMAIHPSKWFKRPGQFNGTIDAFTKIVRNEGVASLWSGLPPTLVMAVPATVVYFTIYDQLRARICKKLSYTHIDQPLWLPMVAGGTARAMAVTLISPLELVRTKIQSKNISYGELGHAIKNSVRTEGILSLWRGLGPTILRDVPFSALYWLNYEFLKKRYKQPDPTFWFSFGAGAASGTMAAVITLPFDVVKTHRQIELGEVIVEESSRKLRSNVQVPSNNTFAIMRRIYSQRGISGLFAGIVPRIIKVAPACAIMISTYEFGKAFFRQYNEAAYNQK